MTILKTTLTIVGSAIGATVIIILTGMIATMVAVATGAGVHVPGMVTVEAGSGADLATASLDAAAPLWLTGITLALTVVTVAVERRRARRRHDVPARA